MDTLGTNTYLIGRKNPYVLLDTGEGLPTYPPVLRSALQNPANSHLPDISDVILTHRHHDHIGGLPSVLQFLRELWDERNHGSSFTPPRVHKFPLPSDSPPDSVLSSVIKMLPEGSFTPGPNGALHDLRNGQAFTAALAALDTDPADQTLEIMHTPGHTADSISLLYPADRALFTGDTVLGQGTAVFEDLSAYITSLRTMLHAARTKLRPEDGYDTLYPAHGPIVRNGPETITMYITHRLDREAQILEVLRTPWPDGAEAWTTWAVVEKLYAKYPRNLWEPAAHGITLHLKKLEKERWVVALGGADKEARWALLENSKV
jgi:ribonuclease/clavin/mitogillin